MNTSPEWLPSLWRFDEEVTIPRQEGSQPPVRLPAVPLRCLGDPEFCAAFQLQYPYMAGSMANGIASAELVMAMAERGMLASFGAAGLPIDRIDAVCQRLVSALPDKPFAVNLIHSPNEPQWEDQLVDVLLKRGVRVVEASAFMQITEPLVRYRLAGLQRDAQGRVVCANQVIAKVSRVEVAEKFMSPPPEKLVASLLQQNKITADQAAMAKEIPLARFVTAEADSGGHTDNRPLLVLLPLFIDLKNRQQQFYQFTQRLMVGAAGGLGTPRALAAAFATGAAYVVTGTINQSCVEAGTSQPVRDMLAAAGQADCAMAPAADMFELGIKVQVLKRGTMFPMRAQKLFELYRQYPSLEALPPAVTHQLEKQFFQQSLAEVWQATEEFFRERDPQLLQRARGNERLRMALVFRSYLGRSSTWANRGEPGRQMDYQVWCGPVMGAFNSWCRGSFLETPEQRHVANIGLNLMTGAGVLSRLNLMRAQGFPLADDNIDLWLRPKTDMELIQLQAGG